MIPFRFLKIKLKPLFIFALFVSLFFLAKKNHALLSLPIHGKKIILEIANTEESRSKGLMNRHYLSPYSGMLFIFEKEKNISMWMKNTPLRLDMIWINQYGIVVHSVFNTTPFSEEILCSPLPAKYIIELEHPFGKNLNLKKGTHVPLPQYISGF